MLLILFKGGNEMKSWKWMSMVLVICLLLGNTMPFYAAEASEAEKLQEQIEQLE